MMLGGLPLERLKDLFFLLIYHIKHWVLASEIFQFVALKDLERFEGFGEIFQSFNESFSLFIEGSHPFLNFKRSSAVITCQLLRLMADSLRATPCAGFVNEGL